MDILTVSVIVAGVTIAIGTIMPAFGQGRAVTSAMESLARQPEARGPIQTNLLLGLAFMESLTLYALVISLILIFVNPFAKPARTVAESRAKIQLMEDEINQIQLENKLAELKQGTAGAKK